MNHTLPYRLSAGFTVNVKDFTDNVIASREARTICIGILEWILECPVAKPGEDERLYRMLANTLGVHNAGGLSLALRIGGDDWKDLLTAAITCYQVAFDINVQESSTDILVILHKPVNSPHVTLRLCLRRPLNYSEFGHVVESTLTEVEFDCEAVLG